MVSERERVALTRYPASCYSLSKLSWHGGVRHFCYSFSLWTTTICQEPVCTHLPLRRAAHSKLMKHLYHRPDGRDEILTRNTPSFIGPDTWPPNLNPVDYSVWSDVASVGIGLWPKRTGGHMSKCLKFCTGIDI